MKKIAIYTLGSISFFVLLSCGSKKRAQQEASTNDCPEKFELIQKLDALSEMTWDFMSTKTTVAIETSDMSRSAKASLRFERDKAMTANISFMGLLVAQAKLNNDSVLVINRFNKCFIQSDRSALNQFIDIPVEYIQLQNLLIGKPVNHESSTDYQQIANNEYCVLRTKIPRFEGMPITETDFIAIMYFFEKKSFQIAKLKIESPADHVEITASYNDFYEEKFGLALPKQTDLVILNGKDKAQLTVSYGTPSFNDINELVLNIPDKYESCK